MTTSRNIAALSELSRDGGTTAAAPLSSKAEWLHQILSADRLCARLTHAGQSIVVGDKSADNLPVELIFKTDAALNQVFAKLRLIDFAMCYFDGALQINGPISKAIELLEAINEKTDQEQTAIEWFGNWLFRIAKAVHPGIALRFESLDHYAQNASAYELFLDDYMQYTCGRFDNEEADLDEAQVAKFNLIKELATRYIGDLRGAEHLDIGCGWGGMGAYFQERFGTNSVGNTNCLTQMEYARRRYSAEIIYGDFTVLRYAARHFDLITIVGMVEHLTPRRRTQLLKTVRSVLRPQGLVYLQCIVKPALFRGGDVYRVTQKAVFPGHFLETREETDQRLKANGFDILDAIEHGRDYGLTTARWVERLEQKERDIIALIGPRQYRIFLGYLAFASRRFSQARGSLMRYVLRAK